MKRKPNVAFVCVHNSCRSQMAEALGKKLASDVYESYSAGSETKPQINQDVVRLMKQVYGIDKEKCQYSKLMSQLPKIDFVIAMGLIEVKVMDLKRRIREALLDESDLLRGFQYRRLRSQRIFGRSV